MNRVFQCAECGLKFEQPESQLSIRCPECRCKTLILLEGASLKSCHCGGNCGGNCGSCGCGCH